MPNGLDNLNYTNAQALAARIEQYWAAKGFPHVKATVERNEEADIQNCLVFSVRSNLVGGMPPKVRG